MCHPPLIVLTASMPASIVPQPPLVHYNSHSTYCEDDDVCSDCSSSTATEDENIATSKPPSCCCSCCSTAKPASPSYTLCQIRSHCTFDSAWLVAGKDVYDATGECLFVLSLLVRSVVSFPTNVVANYCFCVLYIVSNEMMFLSLFALTPRRRPVYFEVCGRQERCDTRFVISFQTGTKDVDSL